MEATPARLTDYQQRLEDISRMKKQLNEAIESKKEHYIEWQKARKREKILHEELMNLIPDRW